MLGARVQPCPATVRASMSYRVERASYRHGYRERWVYTGILWIAGSGKIQEIVYKRVSVCVRGPTLLYEYFRSTARSAETREWSAGARPGRPDAPDPPTDRGVVRVRGYVRGPELHVSLDTDHRSITQHIHEQRERAPTTAPRLPVCVSASLRPALRVTCAFTPRTGRAFGRWRPHSARLAGCSNQHVACSCTRSALVTENLGRNNSESRMRRCERCRTSYHGTDVQTPSIKDLARMLYTKSYTGW